MVINNKLTRNIKRIVIELLDAQLGNDLSNIDHNLGN